MDLGILGLAGWAGGKLSAGRPRPVGQFTSPKGGLSPEMLFI